MKRQKIDKTTSPIIVDANRLISRLYEEAQDEPECLYWQAANMLERFCNTRALDTLTIRTLLDN